MCSMEVFDVTEEREASLNSEMMVQYVRACIREQRFVVTDHARNEHTLFEGFTVRQGIEALLGGQVIEEYTEREDNVDRLLFCGTAPAESGSTFLYHLYPCCCGDRGEDADSRGNNVPTRCNQVEESMETQGEGGNRNGITRGDQAVPE